MKFCLSIASLFGLLASLVFYAPASAESDSDCLRGIELGNALIEKSPSGFRGYASRGCGYAHFRQYDLAETDFLKAIELKPDMAGLYCNLSSTYYETRRYKDALSAIRKAIELGDRSEATQNAELSLLCLSMNYSECLRRADEVIKLFPADATAYYYRAVCNSELNQSSRRGVLSDLARANSLAPADKAIKCDYELFKSGKKLEPKNR